jgi:hypothetical protein
MIVAAIPRKFVSDCTRLLTQVSNPESNLCLRLKKTDHQKVKSEISCREQFFDGASGCFLPIITD